MPIVRLPGGQIRDEIRQTLYDSFDLEAGVNPSGQVVQFFSSITGKTLAQTNMKQPSQLNTAVSYRVQGLCLDASNRLPANEGCLPVVMDQSSVQLAIGEKIYWQGPAVYACGRLWSDLAPNAAAIINQQYGWHAIQPVVFQGAHVIEIPPLQNFAVTLATDTLSAGDATAATPAANTFVRFRMSLKGLQRRPVQ